MQGKEVVFPASFVWGTATGALPSEGAAEGSDWRIRERSGLAPASGKGNDKRSRYDQDFLRQAELGIPHHRLSIEWSRIEPQKGVYDRAALDDYRIMMEAAERRGITLWVALHHVSLPAWFVKLGGFGDEAAMIYWHRYVELVAKELGKHARFWLTLSEPAAYAAGSCLLGKYPPGWKRLDKFSDMLIRIHKAHGDAYRILKTYLPERARVGIAALIAPVNQADPESESDRISAEFVDGFINQAPLDAIREGVIRVTGKGAVELPTCKGAADFFGIDYFFRLVVGHNACAAENCLASLAEMEGMPGISAHREGEARSEHGFGAYPRGLYEAVKRVHQAGLNLPMYITASGLATRDEGLRSRYLAQCLGEVHGAIEQGLDLRGYFHWSDVDTYEFNLGFDAHYGLFSFDPLSMERSQRPAATLLSKAARDGKLPPGAVKGLAKA
ncbi:MAG TPA: family 1 glycosylhydrolase [bacterium]|nr:family 1 glycosylhydrolase [bacterium]